MNAMIVEIVFSIIFVLVFVFIARAFRRSGKEEQAERQLDQKRQQWFDSIGGQYSFTQQRRRTTWQGSGHTALLDHWSIRFQFSRSTHSALRPDFVFRAPAPKVELPPLLLVHAEQLKSLKGKPQALMRRVAYFIADDDVVIMERAISELLRRGHRLDSQKLHDYVWLGSTPEIVQFCETELASRIERLKASLAPYYVGEPWDARGFTMSAAPGTGIWIEGVTTMLSAEQLIDLLAIAEQLAGYRD